KFVTDAVLTFDPRTPIDPDRQQRAIRRQQRQEKLVYLQTSPDSILMSDTDDLDGESAIQLEEEKLLFLGNLHSWRDKYESSYSVVRKFIPFTILASVLRCAAFCWNPLKASISSETWMIQLLKFANVHENDMKMMAGLIPKIILPILLRYARIYDPASTNQSESLISNIYYLFKFCGESVIREYDEYMEIEKCVTEQIEDTLNSEVFIPLYPNSVAQNEKCGAAKFLRYQCLFQIKLFRNILKWTGILQFTFIVESTIEKILNRCIFLSWKCQNFYSKEKAILCMQIVDSIPPILVSEYAIGEATIPSLQPFCQYIKNLIECFASIESERQLCKHLKEALIRLNSLDLAISV
ncbi:hypothetical protein GJ496_002469, partial [Pomphorhynchus laevis]